MSISEKAFIFASRLPWLARQAVRAWAISYRVVPRPPHWAFERLKRDLGVRVRRRVRLKTGEEMIVDPYDYVGHYIARDGCYEPETVALVQGLLGPGMVFLDVGAHLGQYTLIASSLVGRTGKVHAFEPAPGVFAELRRNVDLNDRHNVVLNPTGLSDAPAAALLSLSSPGVDVGGNSLRPTRGWGGQSVEVRVATLDEYASAGRLGRIDLVKVDVEGAELLVLRGGDEVVARFQPVVIMEVSHHVEQFGYRPEELARWFESRGYELFLVGPLPLGRYDAEKDGGEYFNVLAAPGSRVNELVSRGLVGT